jgi:hypothetical protein
VHDSDQARRSETPSRRTLNISSSPSGSDLGALGVLGLELGGETLGHREAAGCVEISERVLQLAVDAPDELRCQVVGHVLALVQVTHRVHKVANILAALVNAIQQVAKKMLTDARDNECEPSPEADDSFATN